MSRPPFFQHFLKGPATAGPGPRGLPCLTPEEAVERFDRWPATNAQWSSLALRAGGKLQLDGKPGYGSDAYVSDPHKPVPGRCVGTSIEGFTMYQYMSDDQRCFSTRPDVLTYETEPLTDDVTLGGEIRIKLKVASTGTDADFIVKLVDVFPADAP
ncbi:MAG: hypothetical protein IPG88_20760 [Gemmatimonadetes bacterium]|nr:hypothetical protein [Gemmatimonadota bacterium]